MESYKAAVAFFALLMLLPAIVSPFPLNERSSDRNNKGKQRALPVVISQYSNVRKAEIPVPLVPKSLLNAEEARGLKLSAAADTKEPNASVLPQIPETKSTDADQSNGKDILKEDKVVEKDDSEKPVVPQQVVPDSEDASKLAAVDNDSKQISAEKGNSEADTLPPPSESQKPADASNQKTNLNDAANKESTVEVTPSPTKTQGEDVNVQLLNVKEKPTEEKDATANKNKEESYSTSNSGSFVEEIIDPVKTNDDDKKSEVDTELKGAEEPKASTDTESAGTTELKQEEGSKTVENDKAETSSSQVSQEEVGLSEKKQEETLETVDKDKADTSSPQVSKEVSKEEQKPTADVLQTKNSEKDITDDNAMPPLTSTFDLPIKELFEEDRSFKNNFQDVLTDSSPEKMDLSNDSIRFEREDKKNNDEKKPEASKDKDKEKEKLAEKEKLLGKPLHKESKPSKQSKPAIFVSDDPVQEYGSIEPPKKQADSVQSESIL